MEKIPERKEPAKSGELKEIAKQCLKKIEKGKGGRPPLNLDSRQIYELAKIHCTMKEIAAVMDCSVDTLERRFADLINKGREEGKTTLRKYMWKAAEKGNVTMQIWLSKQLLEMHEPQVIEVREETKSPFNHWYDEQRKRADNADTKRQTSVDPS